MLWAPDDPHLETSSEKAPRDPEAKLLAAVWLRPMASWTSHLTLASPPVRGEGATGSVPPSEVTLVSLYAASLPKGFEAIYTEWWSDKVKWK